MKKGHKQVQARRRPRRPSAAYPLRGYFCPGLYILDEHGEPVAEPETLKWAEWMQANSRSAGDDSVGPYRVSTVFLAVDYAHGLGPPVLWETIIFGLPDDVQILGVRWRKTVHLMRYTSKADALAGHARAIKLAESLPQPLTPADASGAD